MNGGAGSGRETDPPFKNASNREMLKIVNFWNHVH